MLRTGFHFFSSREKGLPQLCLAMNPGSKKMVDFARAREKGSAHRSVMLD